jgi:hypothetical protein
VRELLAECRLLEFHESMLELLGAARMSRDQVARHLAALTGVFDAAAKAINSPFPFASDLSAIARPIAIEGSRELIDRGYHREAMFWIAVTHSRCQTVLPLHLRDSYRDLVTDLGIASPADIRQRCAEIERFLPRVWEAAESIMAVNPPYVFPDCASAIRRANSSGRCEPTSSLRPSRSSSCTALFPDAI